MASPTSSLQEYIYKRLKYYLDPQGEDEDKNFWNEFVHYTDLAKKITFLIYYRYGFGFNDINKLFVIATDVATDQETNQHKEFRGYRIAIFVASKSDQVDLLVDAKSEELWGGKGKNLCARLNYQVDREINAVISKKLKQVSNGTSNPKGSGHNKKIQ